MRVSCVIFVPAESKHESIELRTVFQSNVIIFDYLLFEKKVARFYILNQQQSDVYLCMKAE